jgi:hypothetical protein
MKNDAVEQRTGPGRVDEVVQSTAETLAVSCPFCLTLMSEWSGCERFPCAGQPVAAGLYLYTIEAGEFKQTKKMVLLK